jgi:hypothetical protein
MGTATTSLVVSLSILTPHGENTTPEMPPKFAPRQVASSPVEQPPKFTPRSAYQQCKLAVESGKRCKLYVGITPSAIDGAELAFHVDTLPGVSIGVYDCWLENGVPMMQACISGT